MKIWKNLDINEKGHLCLGGNDSIELAEKYGTPLYVMEEDVIRSVCRSYMQVIREKNIPAKIAYASKAFMTTAMCRIVESEGLHLDVVSEGEFRTAMNAGFDTAKIYYHGNNKTEHELETAIKNGVGCIIIDSFHEVDVIDQLAEKYGEYDNVIFEIYNEPMNVGWDEIKTYAEIVIPAIREHSDNLIIVGTPNWSQQVTDAAYNPVTGENIAYALHFYAGTHKEWLRNNADAALEAGIPLFVTEWGSVNADGNGGVNDESTQEWFEWIDKNQLSSCNWAINDKDEGSNRRNPRKRKN